MNKQKVLTFIIASVWIVNGLICKILNLVPRHQEIVARILGDNSSRIITIIIGASETLMAAWILSNYKSKLNAITQIVVVSIMNIIEFIMAPDLLLWGKFNSFFALLFIILVYYTNFKINKLNAVIS